jgi:hypothetical protein
MVPRRGLLQLHVQSAIEVELGGGRPLRLKSVPVLDSAYGLG